MDTLFSLTFFASLIALVAGLIKPTIFSRFIKGEATRKKVAAIFGIAAVVSFVLFAITTDAPKNNNKLVEQPVLENTNPAPAVEKTTTGTVLMPAKQETNTTSSPTQVSIPAPTPTPVPQSERERVLVILKANASTKWGTNYQMVKFEYDNQVEAYDWVTAQTKYPAIMAAAKQKWGDNYQMVKFEYDDQVEAYEWIIAQTAYPDIMAKAKQKWGTNYQMVKFEYDNQVEAFKGL